MSRFDDYSTSTMDDCIRALVTAKGLIAEYDAQSVPVPESLRDSKLRLERRIRDLRHDQMAHRATQLRCLLAAKQPPEQQIEAWRQELASLDASLGA